jgi:hypothetical protein
VRARLGDHPQPQHTTTGEYIMKTIMHTGAKLIEAENPPESFYLLLQKQFALKLLNTDRHYTSQLGKAVIEKYQTKIKKRIQRKIKIFSLISEKYVKKK